MSRRKTRTRAEHGFSLRSVPVLTVPLLILVNTKLSGVKQSDANLAVVTGVRKVADACQNLGLTALGTVLFFLGSMLEAERSRGRNSVDEP